MTSSDMMVIPVSETFVNWFEIYWRGQTVVCAG